MRIVLTILLIIIGVAVYLTPWFGLICLLVWFWAIAKFFPKK